MKDAVFKSVFLGPALDIGVSLASNHMLVRERFNGWTSKIDGCVVVGWDFGSCKLCHIDQNAPGPTTIISKVGCEAIYSADGPACQRQAIRQPPPAPPR